MMYKKLVTVLTTLIIVFLALPDVCEFAASRLQGPAISDEENVSGERGAQDGPLGKVGGFIFRSLSRRAFAWTFAIILLPILLGLILVPLVR